MSAIIDKTAKVLHTCTDLKQKCLKSVDQIISRVPIYSDHNFVQNEDVIFSFCVYMQVMKYNVY